MRFEDLDVWKRGARLCAEIYKEMRDLSDFGFRDQIIRSALSIPSNIAEGFERDSVKKWRRFLSCARGSCGELRTQLYIGMEIGYVDRQLGRSWVEETRALSAMITKLSKAKQSFLGSGNPSCAAATRNRGPETGCQPPATVTACDGDIDCSGVRADNVGNWKTPIWGRPGFDGDSETEVACRGRRLAS